MKFKLLFEIPYQQLEDNPLKDALATKVKGEWKKYSSRDFIDTVQQVSQGLLEKGIEKGENVGMISFNRPEWNFVDIGMQQIGAVNVPLYPNISQEEYKYILNHAEIKTLFVENKELFEKISEIKDEVDSLQNVYTFDEVESAEHWTNILDQASEKYNEKIEEIKSTIEEDDLATIVYTSGTTGKPKGVMLTHKNIVSNVQACQPLLPVDKGSRALSFLPLNHIFERMLTYLYMSAGVSIYYAEDIDSVGDNLKEVKPHIFTTVPRLLEKVYEKIVAKGKEQNVITKSIFFWALNLAKNYELKGKSLLYKLQLKIANKLVFSKWLEALGGNIKLIVTGGAALNPKLARIFTAAQIAILEGYGLTETSPVIAVNRYEKEGRKFGTVGKPIDGSEVKLSDEDEILCKGPNVMQGYFKKEDKTKKVLDKEGWFNTEDLGSIDDEGFLIVKDRKDSVFKTSGGKKVAPQPVQNHLKESSFIDQALVLGSGQKMVTALISPDFNELKNWCKENNTNCDSNKDMIKTDKVKQHFEKIIDELNQDLSHTDQIKKFRLVAEEWSVESGELTPTQKVKRPVLKEKYESLIEELYTEEDD